MYFAIIIDRFEDKTWSSYLSINNMTNNDTKLANKIMKSYNALTIELKEKYKTIDYENVKQLSNDLLFYFIDYNYIPVSISSIDENAINIIFMEATTEEIKKYIAVN